MKVEEVYHIYRIFSNLSKAVEEQEEPELRKRARAAAQILERVAFRLKIPDKLWAELEEHHERVNQGTSEET